MVLFALPTALLHALHFPRPNSQVSFGVHVQPMQIQVTLFIPPAVVVVVVAIDGDVTVQTSREVRGDRIRTYNATRSDGTRPRHHLRQTTASETAAAAAMVFGLVAASRELSDE